MYSIYTSVICGAIFYRPPLRSTACFLTSQSVAFIFLPSVLYSLFLRPQEKSTFRKTDGWGRRERDPNILVCIHGNLVSFGHYVKEHETSSIQWFPLIVLRPPKSVTKTGKCPYEYSNNQKMTNLEMGNCPKVIRNLSVHTAYPY